MDTLFVKVNGGQLRPVSIAEIKDQIRRGSFGKEDLIWSEEDDDWIAAQEMAELKSLFYETNGRQERSTATIYAIAGGKGGVGKTALSASLGVCLAAMGKEVIMVDADLGGANLHTCMGMLEPRYTLFDFYTLEKETLTDIVLPTPVENLRLISGVCGTLDLANPTPQQKQSFIQAIKKLQADVVILDLGAGSTLDTIDFFLLAEEKILIATPEPTSIYETFGFIKVCLLRALKQALKDYPAVLTLLARQDINRPGRAQLTISDLLREVASMDAAAAAIFQNILGAFKPKLILNMVQNEEHIKEGMALQIAARELLALNIQYLGYVSFDLKVSEAVMNTQPFLLYAPQTKAAQDLAALVRVNLLGKKGFKEFFEKRRWQKQIKSSAKEYPDANPLKNAPICSVNCFYWDNCEFQQGGLPCRVRHLEPVLSNTNGHHPEHSVPSEHFAPENNPRPYQPSRNGQPH